MRRIVVVGLVVALALPWPAMAVWEDRCSLAARTSQLDAFGARVLPATSCLKTVDVSGYATTAVFRDGVRLRPTVAYVYLRRGAARATDVFVPFPAGYTAHTAHATYRCAGESAKGPVPPTACSRGSRGLLRVDLTFSNAKTPYAQLVVVTKYRAGVARPDGSYDFGTITTAGPMAATFVSGWDVDVLADILEDCLGVGARCPY